MKRRPPSRDNPVVIEGILPDGPDDFDPFETFPLESRRVLVLAPEPHIRRLIQVNLERQNYEAVLYASPSEIPLVETPPGLLIFDGDAWSDRDIEILCEEHNWPLRSILMLGNRATRFMSNQRLQPLKVSLWPWFLASFGLAMTALLIWKTLARV